jgi:hypothetical protein
MGAFVVQNSATAPASPVPGQIYFNTASAAFFGWTGSAWKQLSAP